MAVSPELLEKSQEMIWELLDDQITDARFVELENLLREHEQVRQLYVQCAQIHVDLQGLFTGKTPAVFNFGSQQLPLGATLDFELPGGGAFPADVI